MHGKTIGFVGAGNGVGTTHAALSTADWLVGQRRSVIAAEVQPWLGAFARQLRLTPRSTLSDVLGSPARLESDLERHLTTTPTGLRVLPGPRQAMPPRLFCPEILDRLLHALSDRAEYVVVDLPAGMPESFSQLVRHLDHVALVVQPHGACVQATRQLVERLRRWGLGPTRLSAVAVHKERGDSASLETVRDLCSGLGITMSGEVPRDADTSAAFAAVARELAAEVDHLRPRVALVTHADDVARRLHGLMDDADPVRFDVTRVKELDDLTAELLEGAYDAVLLVQDEPAAPMEQLVRRTLALAERTAVLVIATTDRFGLGGAGLGVGAQDELHLDHTDAYWLSHAIRNAIERRRLQAELEREVRDLVACETDLRRLVVQLLRESHHDPRMV